MVDVDMVRWEYLIVGRACNVHGGARRVKFNNAPYEGNILPVVESGVDLLADCADSPFRELICVVRGLNNPGLAIIWVGRTGNWDWGNAAWVRRPSNLTGPTATIATSLSLSSTPPATGIWWVSGTDFGCNEYQYLVFGTLALPSATCGELNPAQDGIGFQASPPPNSGRFEWVQLITSDVITGTAPGQTVTPTIRPTGMDTFYPYLTIDTSWTSTEDAPPVSLSAQIPPLATETRSFSAIMYLLWSGNADDVKGTDQGYIDAPIGYVTWSINGTADQDSKASPPWSLAPGQGATTAAYSASKDTGSPAHGLPAWKTVAYPSTGSSGALPANADIGSRQIDPKEEK